MKWRIPERFAYLIPVAERFGNYGAYSQQSAFAESLSENDLETLAQAWNQLLAHNDLQAFFDWLSTMDAVTSARGGGWQMAQLFSLYRLLSKTDPRIHSFPAP